MPMLDTCRNQRKCIVLRDGWIDIAEAGVGCCPARLTRPGPAEADSRKPENVARQQFSARFCLKNERERQKTR